MMSFEKFEQESPPAAEAEKIEKAEEKLLVYTYDQLIPAYKENSNRPVELPDGQAWESAVMSAAVNKWWQIPKEDPNTHKLLRKRNDLIQYCEELGVAVNYAQISNIYQLNQLGRPDYRLDDSGEEGGWLMCRKPNTDRVFIIPADHMYFTDNTCGFILVEMYGDEIETCPSGRGFTFERMLRPCEFRDLGGGNFEIEKRGYLKQLGIALPEEWDVQEATLRAGVAAPAQAVEAEPAPVSVEPLPKEKIEKPAAELVEQPVAAAERKVEAEKREKPADFYADFENNFNIKKEELEKIEGWRDLSEGQRFLVLENLSQVTLGRIHEEAQEKHKKETVDSKFLGKVWRGISKQYQIAKQEKLTAKEIKEGGMEVHGKVLEQLTRGVKEIGLDATIKEGKLEVQYVVGLENLTPQEQRKIEEFNRIANEYGRLPYEWSLATATKKQTAEFKKAANLFAEAKQDILDIKARRDGENEAIIYTLQLENKIKWEQYLNTHPEVEEELKKIESPELWTKALKTIATERGLIFTAGFVTRSVTTAMLGTIGLPAAAAIVGGWLARRRAYETLKEREMAGRKGVIDKSKEAANFVDTEHLTKRIDLLVEQIKNEPDEVRRTMLVDKLKLRLDYTQDKINSGRVNFGAADKRLNNQYSLIESINAASVWNVFGRADFEKTIRLEQFLEFKEKKVKSARQKFVLKQMAKGAGYGAAFALAGWAARHFMDDLVEVIKGKPAGVETAAGIEPQVEVSPETPPETPAIPETPETTAVMEKIEAAEKLFEKQLKLATIRKGEGIIHAVRRQLLDDPQGWGYKGDLNDAAALSKWANVEAGHLAVANNYFDPKAGFEVRVKWLPDHKVSYLLEKTPEGKIHVNEYFDGESSGGEAIDKAYEYGYVKPVPIKEVIATQEITPVAAEKFEPSAVEAEYRALEIKLDDYHRFYEETMTAGKRKKMLAAADQMFDILDKNPKLKMFVERDSLDSFRNKIISGLDEELRKEHLTDEEEMVRTVNPKILFEDTVLLGRSYGLNQEQGNLFARFLAQGDKMSKKAFENLLTDGHLDNNRLTMPLEHFKNSLQAEHLPAGKLWEPRLVSVSGETRTVLVHQIKGQYEWMNADGNKQVIEAGKLKNLIMAAHPVEMPSPSVPQSAESTIEPPPPEAPPTPLPIETTTPSVENYFDAATYITKATPEDRLNMLREAIAGGKTIESEDIKMFLKGDQLVYQYKGGSETVLTSENLKDFEKLAGLKIVPEEIKPPVVIKEQTGRGSMSKGPHDDIERL